MPLTGSIVEGGLNLVNVFVCMIASLVFGLGVALIYKGSQAQTHARYNKNFVVTLALLPIIVQIIIMLVNGHIGAGVAATGAFSLLRFRSAPGNARDITAIFFAMALGFVSGMGYLFYGFIFMLITGSMILVLSKSKFLGGEQNKRVLKITIPENMDYDGLFDTVFSEYTLSAELDNVRTTNLGSLYELTWHIQLKDVQVSRAFIDALRALNGNLNISISREHPDNMEL
jgi:hypothetical protein